jgi:hypothetical protein
MAGHQLHDADRPGILTPTVGSKHRRDPAPSSSDELLGVLALWTWAGVVTGAVPDSGRAAPGLKAGQLGVVATTAYSCGPNNTSFSRSELALIVFNQSGASASKTFCRWYDVAGE